MLPFRSTVKTRWRAGGLLVACVLWLAACGGGVDSGGTGSFASGPITGFGSVIVGGVHYDDSMAAITDEFDALSSSANLRLGMVTEIRAWSPMDAASMPQAQAMSVRYRSEIVGPVDLVDVATGSLSVLGQRVKVSAKTAFDPALTGGLTALQAGDIVEVYGQFDAAAGRYAATRIEPRTGAALFKLRGRVGSVNSGAGSMVIGALTIDLSAVTPPPNVTAGQTVRVLLQTTAQGANWLATAVEVEVNKLPDRPVAEIDGRITSFVSVRQFSVDGFAVTTSDATLFPDGMTGLVLGAKVEAKGSSRDGVMNATRVRLESDDDNNNEAFELTGSLSALNTVAKTFVIRGVTVSYASAPRFDGGLASDLRRARRAAVKGKLSSDGTRLDASFIHMEF